MFDLFARWRRKISSGDPNNANSDVESGASRSWPSVPHRRADLQHLTVSHPVPRPQGPLTGLGASEHDQPSGQTFSPLQPYWQNSNIYGAQASNVGNESQVSLASTITRGRSIGSNTGWPVPLSDIQDDRPMGHLGRRRSSPSPSIGRSQHDSSSPLHFQGQPQTQASLQVYLGSPPAVVRPDSTSSQNDRAPFPANTRGQAQTYAPQIQATSSSHSDRGPLRLQTTPIATGNVCCPHANTQNTQTSRGTGPALRGSAMEVHTRPSTYSTDVYGNSYSYPMVKQLSPIVEQEYCSPDSLKHAKSILGSVDESPSGSGSGSGKATASGVDRSTCAGERGSSELVENSPSGATEGSIHPGPRGVQIDVSFSTMSTGTPRSQQAHPSPAASTPASDITRPSPSYSSPFITRHVNRTLSQSSTRTHTSISTATIPAASSQTPRQQPSTPIVYSTSYSYDHSIQASTSANAIGTGIGPASEPPVIPPLDFRPPFPGPHPSHNGPGPPLRQKRSKPKLAIPPPDVMPSIPGSTEGPHYDENDDEEDERAMYTAVETEGDGSRVSLHPESYVTAGDGEGDGGRQTIRYADEVGGQQGYRYQFQYHEPSADAGPSRRGLIVDVSRLGQGQGGHRGHDSMASDPSNLPSVSESFITRRWDRDFIEGLPTNGRRSITIFKVKKQFMNFTPAFWAFWLGWICPMLWLVGGWHFTNFGELPPKMTVWEFYFNAALWRELCCCCCLDGRRKAEISTDKGKGKGKELGRAARMSIKIGKVYPPLPRWVAEKQSSDDGRARLNDPKRTLRGISYGYPFVTRPLPVNCLGGSEDSSLSRIVNRMTEVISKPNRLLDQLYGVKLKEVRGRPESERRMFDPWIQRCRYAFCYALLVISIALCTASTYLIVYNTRNLH